MAASPPNYRAAVAGPAQDRLLALGVLALGLLTRLTVLDADAGWFDEIYSIYTAMQPLGPILRDSLAERTNPPGYFLLVHLWGALGGGDISIGWHRLPGAIAGAASPALLVLAARRLRLSRTAAVVVGVLAVVAPMPWLMSLEVRSYAFAALLTCVALWLASGLVMAEREPTPRQQASLALVFVGMVLLHYVAAFAVFGITLGLLAARHTREGESLATALRRAVVLGAPAALVLGAWLLASFRSGPGLDGRNVAWIPVTPTLVAFRDVPGLLLAPLSNVGSAVSSLFTLGGLGVLGAWITKPARDPRASTARFLAFAAVLPLLLFLALHAVMAERLWVPRYVTSLLPALLLMLAIVIDAVPAELRRGVAVGVAAWWMTAGAFAFAERWPKPDWPQLLAALAPTGSAQICADGSFAGLPIIYYARLAGLDGIRVVSPSRCTPQPGLTWLVYEARVADRATQTPGLILGPRIVLTRGLQDLDARRVVGWTQP